MDSIYREQFWNISRVWLFYVLAGLALAVFAFGVADRVAVWKTGFKARRIGFSAAGIRRLIIDGLLGARIIKGDLTAGIIHLMIFWGFLGLFLGTLSSAVDHYVVSWLRGNVYLAFSRMMEVCGAALIIGTAAVLLRRYLIRVPRLERRGEDLIIPAWLITIAVTGFLVKSARLAATQPAWGEASSFVGPALTGIFSSPLQAQDVHVYLWWGHALLSLGLIAYLPFSKLFHALAAPANIYVQTQPRQFVSVEDRSTLVGEFSQDQILFSQACTRCGRCTDVCPACLAGEPFSPRNFVAAGKTDATLKGRLINRVSFLKKWAVKRLSETPAISPGLSWYCTTCRACLEVCPIYAAPLDLVREVRIRILEDGRSAPPLVTRALENLLKYSNPWESSKKKRDKWMGDLTIPDLTRNVRAEWCYFVGCTTSIDLRAQEIARAFSRILIHTGVSFGTLGKKETCCGDIARCLGEEGLFETLGEDTLALFQKHEITRVVTSSPHCFHTFKNEYPLFQESLPEESRVDFSVSHYSRILAGLSRAGRLSFSQTLNLTVTYHDPCYLGRHNGIYDEPRQVIQAIPGVTLKEMIHYGPDSLCCGGGGGRMWQELSSETKISEVRIREAAATGADVVITACPYCLIMLEDARKTAGLEDSIKVLDLNELVLLALGLADRPSERPR
ncbi:MAG: 4Fe-4S dicluster domain-containing protein [Deltaproteobacteria bacterium]|nr:4Fe-4S dicluster domain-containing protein [Deltaproteobacteria bacterium]